MTRVEQGKSVVPLSEQLELDKKSVEADLDYTKKILVDLLPRPFEKYPVFIAKRDRGILGMGPFERLEVQMLATAEEINSAPQEAKALFLDLGIKEDDELIVELSIGKRKNNNPNFTDKIYSVILSPNACRSDQLAVHFNYARQLWFLNSGTHSAADINEKTYKLGHAYDLLANGLVHDSHVVGTHASYTEYEHMPHPHLAAMHRGVADWIVNLIDARMK